MAIRSRIQFDGKDNSRAAMLSVQRGLQGVERQTAGLVRGLFALGGTAGLGLAIRRSLEFADAIGKTADKVGVGVEALQELRFAARQNGVEQKALDIGLQRFTRRLGEAAVGQGELRQTLEQYGIAVRDANGNIRSTEDVLRDYADAVKNAGSSQEQLRLAFKGFDSEGAALVNLLRRGSGAFDEYGEKARNLGIVLDEDLVRNAEVANDKLRDLTDVLQVKFAATVTTNADAIVKLADALIKMLDIGPRKIVEFGEALGYLAARAAGFSDFVDRSNELGEEAQRLKKAIAELETVIIPQKINQSNFPNPQDDPVVQFWQGRATALRQQVAVIEDQVELLSGGLFTPPKKAPKTTVDNGSGGGVLDPTAEKERAKQITQIMAKLDAEVSQFGFGETARGVAILANLGASQETLLAYINQRAEIEKLTASEEDRQAAAERRLDLEAESQALIQGARTASEEYAMQLTRINFLLGEGVLSLEDAEIIIGRMNEAWEPTKQAVSELDQFAIQAARNMQSAFADFLFDPFEDGLKGMLRGFIDTMRKMVAEIAAQQILKSLFGGFAGESGILGAFGDAVTGKRAMGGPVGSGGTFLVGERGPELLTMGSRSGYITPNHELGGASVTFNIDARGADAQLTRALPAILEQQAQRIKGDIAESMSRRRGLR